MCVGKHVLKICYGSFETMVVSNTTCEYGCDTLLLCLMLLVLMVTHVTQSTMSLRNPCQNHVRTVLTGPTICRRTDFTVSYLRAYRWLPAAPPADGTTCTIPRCTEGRTGVIIYRYLTVFVSERSQLLRNDGRQSVSFKAMAMEVTKERLTREAQPAVFG